MHLYDKLNPTRAEIAQFLGCTYLDFFVLIVEHGEHYTDGTQFKPLWERVKLLLKDYTAEYNYAKHDKILLPENFNMVNKCSNIIKDFDINCFVRIRMLLSF